MNLSLGRPFRLVPRGGPGLSCDDAGVALGDVELVRTQGDDRLGSEVRSVEELNEILRLAYGGQSAEVVQRCHRRLRRTAAQLEAGNFALASLEAVMMGFPELSPAAMAKLSAFVDLEKAGTAWQDEPRIPAGQPGGGQWTTGGSGGATPAEDTNAGRATPSPGAANARNPLLDDGVYRPSEDRPVTVLTGGGPADAEEGFRHGIGGNEPPYEFSELSELFPGLKNEPGLMVPMAPIDSFLGISATANATNLAATEAEYAKLTDEIRAIDPTWRDDELQPLADMSWQGRGNAIKDLLIERAVAYYRVRGDIGPLQVETLKFLQSAVDKAYADGVAKYNQGELIVRRSREEAIGNYVDSQVRSQLKRFLNTWYVPYGAGQNITVNNRDSSTADKTYTVPDARLGKVSFDWTLTAKTLSTPQVRGFFAADSRPDAVIIIRPSQLGPNSTYLITRPASRR